ncbi:MAG: hypothetical protein WDW36_007780 [Sanguina aurantia]
MQPDSLPDPPSPSSSKDGAYRSASSAFDASGLSRAVAKLAAFEAYSELLAPKSKQPSLLSAAVLIARHANPDANEAACSAAIDDIVRAVQAELPPKAYPLRIVNTIVRVMYSGKASGGLGFRGNDTDYSSPSNSDISLVLERRTGIPITLSLVFMEVAARLGVPFVGVPFPGHFMCRPSLPDVEVLVDAFSGTVCTFSEAEAMLSGRLGAPYKLDPQLMDGAPMDPRAFLLRMLNNLRSYYLSNRFVDSALVIIRYTQATEAGMEVRSYNHLRDEALCLYVLERWHEAIAVLRQYLELQPAAPDAAMIYVLIERLTGLLKADQEQNAQASRVEQIVKAEEES